MAFNDTLGNTIWKTSRSDSKIFDLANGSESDRFTQILDLLTTNKEYYLQNGLSEDQWFDRVLYFAYQRGPDVSGYPFIIDSVDVLPIDYMNDKDITWFNNDDRWNIATKILINAVDDSLSLFPAGASDIIKNLPMSSARIVYAKNSPGTEYTDSYEEAESSLYEAMKNTRSLGTEDSVKGDGKVTFRELICVAEN